MCQRNGRFPSGENAWCSNSCPSRCDERTRIQYHESNRRVLRFPRVQTRLSKTRFRFPKPDPLRTINRPAAGWLYLDLITCIPAELLLSTVRVPRLQVTPPAPPCFEALDPESEP